MPFAIMILFLLGWAGSAIEPAWGHGGEDHGAPQVRPTAIIASGLGTGAQGDLFEVVITPATGESAWIHLSDAMSNAPIAQATIDIEMSATPPWTGTGTPTPTPGVYLLNRSIASDTAVDLTITVASPQGADLILVALPSHPAPPPPTAASATGMVFDVGSALDRSWVGGGVIIAVIMAGGWLLRHRRKKNQVALMIGAMLAIVAGQARGHGGEDHGPPRAPQASMVAPGGAGGRIVSLPKSSQFLLDLRTLPAASREVNQTLRLVGRVIPDPAFHARIHPQVASRIGYDPSFPPPRSGQKVKQGQTLAVLDPILSIVEKTGQRLSLFKGAISDTSFGREMVLAPMDGQLTDVHIIPGDVVTEGDVLAELIDPAHLWVEAVLYDFSMAQRIQGGTASTRQLSGQYFPLVLTGISPKVNPENQGLHLQFSLSEHGGQLKPGMPVDVYAHTGTTTFAIAIPRQAVLDPGGVPMVWVKTAPEQFEGRPVRLGQKSAEWVEILEGVGVAEKVVIQGYNQLNAMR
ncbi:MAG: efflux RND transporter periplasmic adaptor subunit [Magnetococcales bacterium]|nr:efflux RND transporter periplasmic adaptor subunit [Magnetococcales bacterium]